MHLEWGALLLILQLIYLEGVLSIDNAAVLGAMVAHLPLHERIPWPGALRFLRRPTHRLLGGQRLAALKVGLLGAYLGRGLMLFAAAWIVRNKWLLLLGGLYLIYLAVSHFSAQAKAAEEEQRGRRVTTHLAFWAVVLNVELADLAFSLDNVVAAVALSREMWVVLTGVFLGIVTMRFAAGIFVRFIEREPILEAAAYLLILVIGLELLAEEFLHIHFSHIGKFTISLGVIAATMLYARWKPLRAIGGRMRWLRRGLAVLNVGVGMLFWPAGLAFRSLRRLGGTVRGKRGHRRPPAVTKPLSAADRPSPGTHGGR